MTDLEPLSCAIRDALMRRGYDEELATFLAELGQVERKVQVRWLDTARKGLLDETIRDIERTAVGHGRTGRDWRTPGKILITGVNENDPLKKHGIDVGQAIPVSARAPECDGTMQEIIFYVGGNTADARQERDYWDAHDEVVGEFE